MADDDHDQIIRDFNDAVNMAPKELEDWLKTDDSKSVGWADGKNKTDSSGQESVGHHEGERIVEIKHKKKADYTDQDYADMKKVTGYVHRHLAQGGPEHDKEHSRWRYSLKNWGHDPLKKS